MEEWNKSIKKGYKKIALLRDNCTAHVEKRNLSNIEVIPLPPNTTSILQPCDMDIICTLKAYFRHDMRSIIIDMIEDNRVITANLVAKGISILDALHMLHSAWKKVTATMILNCWRNGGCVHLEQQTEVNIELPVPVSGPSQEDFNQWKSLLLFIPCQ